MAKTLRQLKEAVAGRDYEAQSDIDTRLGQWLNDGYAEMSEFDLKDFHKEDTITTLAGVYEYDLPSDYRKMVNIKPEGCQVIEFNIVTRYDRINYDPDNIERGVPQFATIFGKKIYFTPTPDKAYTITVRYYHIPPELSDDSPTCLTRIRDIALVDYGTAMYNHLQKDYNAYREMMGKFYNKCNNWQLQDTDETEDSSDMMELQRQYEQRMRGY